jgi:hypothetical protein
MLEVVPSLLGNSFRSWTQRPPAFRTQIRVIGGQNESHQISIMELQLCDLWVFN